MAEVILRPQARRDLDTIVEQGKREWGADSAKEYIAGIRQKLELLSNFPSLGAPTIHVSTIYRKLGAGSHLIYYRTEGERVIVVRVLHERMDASRHLN